MKAVAFVRPGQMESRDVADPQPGPGEVVVAVAYCGICGSDLHEYTTQGQSLRAAGVFQPIMGHELTGLVMALGEGVQGIAEGDPVVVHPGGSCGRCYYCAGGLSNLCADQRGTGYRHPGGYAQYVAVRQDQAVRLPDSSWLKPAALTEPLGVALRALHRGGLQPGETVFVAGGGPIGLLTLLAARHEGAGVAFVSEPAASRRELAKQLGADHVLDPGEGAASAVRSVTKGLGCDLAVECVGIAPAMDDCLAATRRGGRIVVAGAFEQPSTINLLTLLIQEHSVIGTFGYASEFPEAARLITSGAIDVTPLISGVVGLDELPRTFAELAADRGRHQKVLVCPNPGRGG
ncbi:MAG: alcohol dehydrogenase catalytic domain-containing protein [Chloroflexi bacterium]|nr:alcohol dehydrogenase catalytic domain-containing protein [Chloroflexota bacterium]